MAHSIQEQKEGYVRGELLYKRIPLCGRTHLLNERSSSKRDGKSHGVMMNPQRFSKGGPSITVGKRVSHDCRLRWD